MFTLDLPSGVPPWQRWLLRACVALPLLMLAANLVAWWRWGTDLPFLDDWRAYYKGVARSLHPRDLFEPANNTIAPVGLALDALAQRGLGGNPIAYQSLTMLGVLGGLLWLQWRLLGWVLRDPARQASVFVLTVFMMQSGSYWGEQNLAFHQALPLLFLLGATWLNFAAPGRQDMLRLGGVLVLGLLAGLSYVSGAVGALLMGASWLGLAWCFGRKSTDEFHGAGRQSIREAWSGGWAMLGAGVLSLGLQLFFTRRPGADALGKSMALTWPHEPDFWWYALGKWGRVTGHGFSSLTLEILWVACTLLLLLIALLRMGRQLLESNSQKKGLHESLAWQRLALVFVPFLLLVSAYLALVALGRAGLRGPEIVGAAEVLRFGYGRFHFFWLTLLLPWLAVALILRPGLGLGLGSKRVLLPALAALLAVAGARGVFDVEKYYQSASAFRAGELRCIARQLGSGQPIMCPSFQGLGMDDDWTPAYVHAQDIGASFVRYLPAVRWSSLGETILHWNKDQLLQANGWQLVEALPHVGMRSLGDAQLWISLDKSARLMANCRILNVQLRLRANRAEVAQLFYRPFGVEEFSENHTERQSYASYAAEDVVIDFYVESHRGFSPVLRIDPVEGEGFFQVNELRVGCGLRTEGTS